MREALRALDLVVVIDVALHRDRLARPTTCCRRRRSTRSGSARSSTSSSRTTCSTCDRRSCEPLAGTLPEYEIHSRLCRALGAYTDDDLAPLRDAAAGRPRPRSPTRSSLSAIEQPRPRQACRRAAVRDAGPDADDTRWHDRHAEPQRCGAWPNAARSSNADSIRRAGIGEDAWSRISATRCSTRSSLQPHGLTFTIDDYDETMRRLETPDKKVSLAIPRLLEELDTLGPGDPGGRR